MKAKQRPESQQYLNFMIFFLSTGSFGVLYWQIWMFLSFKAIKAKKAALVAIKNKS